jgi:SAM-dependent methyltransferase
MPFRPTFDCLWCGTGHTCRGPDEIEGWAQLCSTCVGKAGDNGFLRFRLRQAITERGTANRVAGGEATPARSAGVVETVGPDGPPAGPIAATPAQSAIDRTMIEYYESRAGEYDDWYLRRGRYEHGPIHDAAWNAELDAAGRWLDAVPLRGDIVELAAGTGWWSPLIASKGDLSIYDAAEAPLDRARDRLLAHRLRAHIHVRDAWAAPDRVVDAVFAGFWLSHVERERLEPFLGLVRRWLKPDGIFAFIDSLPDPTSGATDHPPASNDRSLRRLGDGREFEIVKVHYSPAELEAALRRAGFGRADVATTGRFFLMGEARPG